MVIRIHPQERPKYRFGKAAAAGQAASAAPAVETHASAAITQRITRKMASVRPPNLPFLRFDSIAGTGGMAVVWRAWHKELHRDVAVKVMNRDFASSKEDIRQFMTEVRTMTDLHHPGIVQGYGADCIDGRYYFIMDFVDGYTFGALIRRKSRIPEGDALIVCESVADAMSYAWKAFRVVHCDIKPENIMVDRDGTVKVTDLGLCCATGLAHADGGEDVVEGTPAYISPEQIYGNAALDCRADIYSLGATLYHLTTGRLLFPGLSNDDMLRAHVNEACRAPDARQFVPELSENFCRLLAGMLMKDRDARYADWEDVFNDVGKISRNEPLPFPQGISSMALL